MTRTAAVLTPPWGPNCRGQPSRAMGGVKEGARGCKKIGFVFAGPNVSDRTDILKIRIA